MTRLQAPSGVANAGLMELCGDTHGRVLTMRGHRASVPAPAPASGPGPGQSMLSPGYISLSRYNPSTDTDVHIVDALSVCFFSFIVSIVVSSSHWTAAFRPILTVQLTVAGRQHQDSTCGHCRQITGLGVSTILGMGPILTALWATKKQDAEES